MSYVLLTSVPELWSTDLIMGTLNYNSLVKFIL